MAAEDLKQSLFCFVEVRSRSGHVFRLQNVLPLCGRAMKSREVVYEAFPVG